jgi:acetoin utilization protein AcuB
MTAKPVTITTETNLKDALDIVRANSFRHLPVLDEAGRLVGIVTEKDLVYAAPTASTTTMSIFEVNYVLTRMTAGSIMRAPVITVGPDLPIEEAARVMIDHKIGCLPVVENERLLGIISDTDIFRVFVEGLGGGYPSLRITVLAPEELGSLAWVTSCVANLGANIHSLGMFWGTKPGERIIAFRVEGVERDAAIDGLKADGIDVVQVWEPGRSD